MSPTGFSGNPMLQKGLFSSVSKVLIFEVIGSGKIGGQAYLPAGSYTIIATAAENKGGDYRIESQLTEAAGCSPFLLDFARRADQRNDHERRLRCQ